MRNLFPFFFSFFSHSYWIHSELQKSIFNFLSWRMQTFFLIEISNFSLPHSHFTGRETFSQQYVIKSQQRKRKEEKNLQPHKQHLRLRQNNNFPSNVLEICFEFSCRWKFWKPMSFLFAVQRFSSPTPDEWVALLLVKKNQLICK